MEAISGRPASKQVAAASRRRPCKERPAPHLPLPRFKNPKSKIKNHQSSIINPPSSLQPPAYLPLPHTRRENTPRRGCGALGNVI